MNEVLEEKILSAIDKAGRAPFPVSYLTKGLQVSKEDLADVKALVKALKEQGVLLEEKGKYIATRNRGYYPCEIVRVHGTFGFARIRGEMRDIFIPGKYLMGTMPGDLVVVKPIQSSKPDSLEGMVISVCHESDEPFLGIYDAAQQAVQPDTLARFPIKCTNKLKLPVKDGDKVLVRVTHRGQRHSMHKCEIIRVFGDSQKASNCCQAAVEAAGVHLFFPEEVIENAKEVNVPISEKDLEYRVDLRGEPIFTIDSAHSKDLDDAVSLKVLPDGYELGVHIADVSHYVRRGSALDEEALARGTSVYYANSVIPMLPKELSNGICSLNEKEDRLAFSCFVQLDKGGLMTGYTFQKSVIRSRVKGVYKEINAILGHTASDAILQKYDGLVDTIFQMNDLAAILMKNRFGRGALDIDSTESEIVLDADGVAIDIRPRERGISERIIEEFMLTANEAAATLAKEEGLPFIYRVHEQPPEEKVQALRDVLNLIGLNTFHVRPGSPATTFAKILENSRNTPYFELVNTQVLRSMSRAQYMDSPVGHFGLVLENYAHFTSPIRRYPDLFIHRVLSALVGNMQRDKIVKRFGKAAHDVALSSTNCESKAMRVERDCDDIYKAEYMSKHIGEYFPGVVSSVAPHGLYVTLANTVEGLVKTAHIEDGNFICDNNVRFLQMGTGKSYTIGTKVKIKVEGVNIPAGQIDFVIE